MFDKLADLRLIMFYSCLRFNKHNNLCFHGFKFQSVVVKYEFLGTSSFVNLLEENKL